jgi:XTP/dITP diphosphohydrolase
MSKRTLLFASANTHKLADILQQTKQITDFDVLRVDHSSEELASSDLTAVAERKAEQAFSKFHRLLFVDHTSLEIDAINGFPGTRSSEFWQTLKGKICDVVAGVSKSNRGATMACCLAYTDGKRIYTELQRIRGTVAEAPRGKREFSWDSIFIPEGYIKTFDEMEIGEKNNVSPRAAAFGKMIENLRKSTNR